MCQVPSRRKSGVPIHEHANSIRQMWNFSPGWLCLHRAGCYWGKSLNCAESQFLHISIVGLSIIVSSSLGIWKERDYSPINIPVYLIRKPHRTHAPGLLILSRRDLEMLSSIKTLNWYKQMCHWYTLFSQRTLVIMSPVIEALIVVFRRELLCLRVIIYISVYIYWFHAALKPICEEKSNQRLNLIFESRFLNRKM